jgi:hypothetical protein
MDRHWAKCEAMSTPEGEEMRNIHAYWKGKGKNARRKGIDFYLTEYDIKILLEEAGITIYQVGIGKGKYQLGRIGDTGPYDRDNCRFVTQYQNLQEQWEWLHKKTRLGNGRYV